jgi:NAD(P)-dependent dehydrogenase (short-subunit alcohol dehydrogenase family)
MSLAGLHVVVAGGSSGIGLAVASAVLAGGGRVTIVGRSRERLVRARERLGNGDDVSMVAADIANEADVIRMLDTARDFDHLVATAVDAAYQPITELELDEAQRVLRSKLVGALLLAKHAARRINPGGSLTFTSGIAAYRPSPGGAVVAAVNGALESLARALSIELAPVRVNVVSPGWVDTPVWDAVAGPRKDTVLASMAERLPVGRVGKTTDLAPAYIFLMQSEYTTGSVVHVDGGHRLV